MQVKEKEKEIFRTFGELLEYPNNNIKNSAKRCKELSQEINPEAEKLLSEFYAFVEKNSIGHIEEVYTSTFEMNTSCSPYVGYHLFGETHKRSIFMLELKERYRTFNFKAPENELPDHLWLILQFLSICDNEELTIEIINEAILPVIKKIENTATETYKLVLGALILVSETVINGKVVTDNEKGREDIINVN